MTSNKENYRSVDRLYMPEWLTGQIQVTNFDLVDHMKWLLQQDGRFNEIFRVERKEIEHLKHNQASLRSLLSTPFLMVEPTLQTIEDWRCFVDETPTTMAVDALRRMIPPLDSLAMYAVEQHNRLFLDLVTQVIHMSALCAPLLGITNELAQYLASVQPYKLRFALARMKGLPLFRWRFNSPTFWYEFTANTLTDETIAHQIMLTTPFKTGELPRTAGWSELRLDRGRNEVYAAAMMAHGCRASTASNLFRLNQNAMRLLFAKIHGFSSPMGNQPTSLTWFVESPQQRLHATIYTWLYRSAIATGVNAPEALIATSDIYGRLFSGKPLISVDRGWNLTRWMAVDARLTIAPCRQCRTHYVVSNSDTRIEMHNQFTCPACQQQLGPKRRGAKRKTANDNA
ncbi:FlhC family transcriptional regulator [Paraburkholderia gardini]|uniref:FlhC family transcriptional regulator n=1 Tax=Paraburkholderia gardini TaxID=2823469 RepID=UPI001D1BA363|nr:FlhC family transcriptional regulator [Paraburkholderia gardini]CAG4914193.1 Flagellar transcriptional regulator FlhC [Paraburkholderia gardini]